MDGSLPDKRPLACNGGLFSIQTREPHTSTKSTDSTRLPTRPTAWGGGVVAVQGGAAGLFKVSAVRV